MATSRPPDEGGETPIPSASRRSRWPWFYGTLVLIVVAAVIGASVLRPSSRPAQKHPRAPDPRTGEPGDHWYTALGVNVCGEWLPNPPTFETAAGNPNVRVGINTHGDGYVHVHPDDSSEAGNHATLGLFFAYAGWHVSNTSIDAWTGPTADPAKRSWRDGELCPLGTPDASAAGTLRWSVDCRAQVGNPADYRLGDHQVLSIAFLPVGVPVPVAPSSAAPPAYDGFASSAAATSACQPSPSAG